MDESKDSSGLERINSSDVGRTYAPFLDSPTTEMSAPPHYPYKSQARAWKRRRFMLAACTLFSAVTLFAFVLFNYAQPKFPFETPELVPHAPQSAAGVDRHSVLLGPPTSHFRGSRMLVLPS